jgi:hypothetical protein
MQSLIPTEEGIMWSSRVCIVHGSFPFLSTLQPQRFSCRTHETRELEDAVLSWSSCKHVCDSVRDSHERFLPHLTSPHTRKLIDQSSFYLRLGSWWTRFHVAWGSRNWNKDVWRPAYKREFIILEVTAWRRTPWFLYKSHVFITKVSSRRLWWTEHIV